MCNEKLPFCQQQHMLSIDAIIEAGSCSASQKVNRQDACNHAYKCLKVHLIKTLMLDALPLWDLRPLSICRH